MSETRAYVGVKSCGCAVAATMFNPENVEAEVARDVAEFKRNGYTVREHDVEWVRANLRRCKHGPAKKPKARR
jgi:hypothetical protein